ncbi:hypothetical protein JYU34_006817 [Plutella xylostella]|uniref:ZSWIM3 N-terminal domain-containing protein n=1 Tax=Plutella xylostella TaxID=51655 RepID=A0ABQ7QSY4_PLUXY|nr:hypothetical protein JYU34_006817 [Plutella xylostella]
MEFESLEELDTFITNYERINCVQLWKKTAKTIEKSKAVCPKKLASCNEDLKYYSLMYACKIGGRAFKSNGRGIRHTSTYKDNYPMMLKLALNNDGSRLKIVEKIENHNHPVNRELFESMPKQRTYLLLK